MTQEGDRNTVEGRRSKNGMFALEVLGVVLCSQGYAVSILGGLWERILWDANELSLKRYHAEEGGVLGAC